MLIVPHAFPGTRLLPLGCGRVRIDEALLERVSQRQHFRRQPRQRCSRLAKPPIATSGISNFDLVGRANMHHALATLLADREVARGVCLPCGTVAVGLATLLAEEHERAPHHPKPGIEKHLEVTVSLGFGQCQLLAKA